MYAFVSLIAALVVSGFVAIPATPTEENSEPATVYLPSYLDADPASAFAGDIRTLSATGITRGCDQAERFFCPDAPVTRGQMAAFLVRALDIGSAGNPTSPRFVDTAHTVFHDDIAALAAAGVSKGCNPPVNDEFCPDRPVTRGEMAALLVRALGLPADLPADYGELFADDDGSNFEADIARLAAANVTRGCNPPGNDEFCPRNAVNRQQMAAFLVRALSLDAVPVSPPSVTVQREVVTDPLGSTLTVCHTGETVPLHVRNAGWGAVYPVVGTTDLPSTLTWSSGTYDPATDTWVTAPAAGCATFQSGWDPRQVRLTPPLSELRITSPFGYRFHPIYRTRRLHTGTDFGAPTGSEVYAAADGLVQTAGTDGGFGRTIDVNHAGGLTTRYSHLSAIRVTEGQTVTAGDVIGEVGCTGTCTGPHLHFETWEWGTKVDPMGYLG